MEKTFLISTNKKQYKVTYENNKKIATGLGDDYTTGCFLDYPYFKDSYKIAVDLSKQQTSSIRC